jgi:hypothetical protein
MPSATEDFAGGAAALSGPWSQQRTADTVNKNGSGVGVGSINAKDLFAFWKANAFGRDQYAQLTIAGGLTINSNWAYCTVRASGTTDATFNNYTFFTDGTTGTGHTGIATWINGVQVEILALATTFTTGDVMRIEARGTLVSAYKNGVLLGSVVNSNAALAGGAPGCGVFGNAVTIDNWEGGDWAVSQPPMTQQQRRG